LNLVRALLQAPPYLRFVLVQQVLDELLARIIRIAWDGYIKLKQEGDITACFTGACA